MMKNKLMLMGIGLAVVLGICGHVNAQVTAEKEGVTVIRQGDGGDVQILTKQKETIGGEAKSEARGTTAQATDDSPRKARVMVSPAVWQREYRRRLDRELNEKWGITDPGIYENPGYTSYLTDALVNARKFDMLEREDLKTVLKELDFGETDLVDLQKVQKIGNMVGADYIVIPEIRYLETSVEAKSVPYVGTKQTAVTCKLATSVRTVDVASGKIISSNISETESKARQREEDAAKQRLAIVDIMASTMKESALKEAANLVDVAYPIKIMSVTGDSVMLNRGKGAILEGEMLNVYAAGEMMIDPDTKDNLGYNEALVGKIKVTAVNNKTSQAAIVEKSDEIKKLYVCRRLTAEQKLKQVKEGNTLPPKID
jgi:hypothetical protein